jgi:hypothetical protein
MSDDNAAPTQSAAVANATQALAIKELKDEIGGIRKQFRAMWITIGIVGVITLICGALIILPRFGVHIGGSHLPQYSGTGAFPGGSGGTGVRPQTTPGQ